MLTADQKAEITKREADRISLLYSFEAAVKASKKLIDSYFKEKKQYEDGKRCIHSWDELGLRCLKCGVYE